MKHTWIIWLTGLFFLAYGLAFALFPLTMAGWVTGGSPDTGSAIIDMRSTYGGLSMAVGVVLLMLLRRSSTVPFAFLAVALILGLMAVTRTIGIFVDGMANTVMYLFLGGELLGVLLALYAYRKVTVPGPGNT